MSSVEFEERALNTPVPRIDVEITPAMDGECASCAALSLQKERLTEQHVALSEALGSLADGLGRAGEAAKLTVKHAQI